MSLANNINPFLIHGFSDIIKYILFKLLEVSNLPKNPSKEERENLLDLFLTKKALKCVAKNMSEFGNPGKIITKPIIKKIKNKNELVGIYVHNNGQIINYYQYSNNNNCYSIYENNKLVRLEGTTNIGTYTIIMNSSNKFKQATLITTNGNRLTFDGSFKHIYKANMTLECIDISYNMWLLKEPYCKINENLASIITVKLPFIKIPIEMLLLFRCVKYFRNFILKALRHHCGIKEILFFSTRLSPPE